MSQLLQSITGLGGYSAFGVLIFFTVFVVVSIRTFRLDKAHIEEMSSLPLDTGDSKSLEGDE